MTPDEVEKHPNTPPCPICDGPMVAHINSKMVIGWECLICKKAIAIERTAYKVR